MMLNVFGDELDDSASMMERVGHGLRGMWPRSDSLLVDDKPKQFLLCAIIILLVVLLLPFLWTLLDSGYQEIRLK